MSADAKHLPLTHYLARMSVAGVLGAVVGFEPYEGGEGEDVDCVIGREVGDLLRG